MVEKLAQILNQNHSIIHFEKCLNLVNGLQKWFSALFECILPLLDRLMIGDEKQIFSKNIKCFRQWLIRTRQANAQPKMNLDLKKVLVKLWQDCIGMFHSVTADKCCQQLMYLHTALKEKRFSLIIFKCLVIYHANSWSIEKIEELSWKRILNLPCPDLTPSY